MKRKTMLLITVSVLVCAGFLLAVNAQEDREIEKIIMMKEAGGRSFLGVTLDELDADKAAELKLDMESGALVTDVVKDSPAYKAGLLKNDVVIKWNRTFVESSKHLKRLVSDSPADRNVKLVVIRDGYEKDFTVTLGEKKTLFSPEDIDFEWKSGSGEKYILKDSDGSADIDKQIWFADSKPRLGIIMASNDETENKNKGVIISKVIQGSPAEKAGLTADDIVTAIGKKEIISISDASNAVRGLEAGPVEIKIVRDGKKKTVTADLPEKKECDYKAYTVKKTGKSGKKDGQFRIVISGLEDIEGLEKELKELEELKELKEIEGLEKFDINVTEKPEGVISIIIKGLDELEGLEGLEGLEALKDIDIDIDLSDDGDLKTIQKKKCIVKVDKEDKEDI